MAERSRGTVIAFASNFFAEVDGIDWDGIERAAIDTTHLRTALNQVGGVDQDAAARTFMPADIMDFGSMRVSLFHNSNSRPPIDAPAEIMTFTAAVRSGQSSGATLVGTAFMTGYSVSYKLGEKTMATATVKFSGPVSFTAGA